MTIKDIARETGYAVSTVSRALNDHPDVSAETKARIKAVVEAHQFVPNNNARQLKQSESRNIAIVVKGTSNMLFAPIVERMQELIRQASYHDIVYYLDEDSDEVARALRLCRERKPLGLLFLGGNLAFFQAGFKNIPIPAVLVSSPGESLGFENLSSVTTDDRAAAASAVRYLLENGHREIGVIGGGFERSCTSYLRYEGCMKSLSECNVPFSVEKQYEEARFSFGSAYRAMGKLLDKYPALTAVFAMSDVMAVGAVSALRDRGVRVPEDISVIGFDGIELSEYYNPKLATIRQSGERLAVRGVEIVIAGIENGAPAIHETVPFELAAGESVRSI